MERALRLPDFIGAGPGRAGTTWLHRMLEGHVGMPRRVKEVLFFNQYYAKGLGWYGHHFRGYPAELPIGEITPGYFHSIEARDRIRHDIPDCKIICTFREPAARLYSMYKLTRRYAWTRNELEHALEIHEQAAHEQATEVNRYTHYLKGWQQAFGTERVLVCLYDDLRTDPQAYIDRVIDFIGAQRFTIAPAEASEHVWGFERAPRDPDLAERAWRLFQMLSRHSAYRTYDLLDRLGFWNYCYGRGEPFPPLDPKLEARLKEFYRPEVEEFERLIGRDLSAWKQPTADQPRRAAASAGSG
jgi:hypothetical protein